MKIKQSTSILVIMLLINIQSIYSQNPSYRILKSVSGSGGMLLSKSNQHLHSATSGETISGFVYTENYFLRSGFWNNSQFVFTEVNKIEKLKLPDNFNLYQNFPNPFNPTTSIKYDLPKSSIVKLEIFNILGQKIKTLVNCESKDAGYQQVVWDARNDFGNKVGSGIYIYKIEIMPEVNNEALTQFIKKMILLK